MTSTLLKYNVVLIALCIGMTLVHNSSQVGDGETEENEVKKLEIDLYYDPVSPPCRAVLLTLKAMNMSLNLKLIKLFEKKNLEPSFIAINSLHTVPVLKNGTFTLLESNAIIVYLVRKYGGEKYKSLYPTEDLERLAHIDQILQFDNGTLYPNFKKQYNPWAFEGALKDDDKEKIIHFNLEYLNEFLGKSAYAVGGSMTVADFALVASISTFEVNQVDMKKYTNILEWLQKCKKEMVGYKDSNEVGIEKIRQLLVFKKLIDPLPETPVTPTTPITPSE